MKTITKKKLLLQKQLNDLQAQELNEIRIKHYPIFKKKYEGKYFKVSNGYNHQDRWYMYIKVTSIKPYDVYDTRGNGITSHFEGYKFEVTSDENINIEKIKCG